MSSNNKIIGSARGCGPGGTAGELPRKKIDTVRPEPPSEVLAEAVSILRADRRGRWHVRAPDGARHRDGLHAWSISNREAERLLRLLWPNYVASRQRLADRLYGGEVSRVPASWRYALEAALDREADARRHFARRREKWEQERRQSEELRRRRMPPEQRRELERKEQNVRKRASYAELDERDKARAIRILMEAVSHIRHGRMDRIQHLLASLAEVGSAGATPEDVAYMIVRRDGHRLEPKDRERRGREIAQALVACGVLIVATPDRFLLKTTQMGVGSHEKNGSISCGVKQ